MSTKPLYLALVFLSLSAHGALADGVITSATCQIVGTSVTGSPSCQLGNSIDPEIGEPNGYAKASATASASIGSNGGWANISVSSDAFNGVGGPFDLTPEGGYAQATADIHYSFTAPANTQYLFINLPTWQMFAGAGGENMTVTESLQIGSFSLSCDANQDTSPLCNGASPFGGAGHNADSYVVPITGGDSYTFDFTATATAADIEWEFPSGYFTGSVDFSYTPVPEPAAWRLLSAPLLLLLARRRFHRPSAQD